MRIVVLGGLFALVSAVAACGSGDPTVPEADGGTADASPGDSATKDSAALDGSNLDASPGDASVSDAAPDSGVTATGSTPPAGATLCGSGTFTPADSMNVCQASSPYFPPMYTVTKACGGAGFTFVSGLWEAWCTPSSTYLFARFDDATGFESVAASGAYESGNGGGSANAYFDLGTKHLYVSSPSGDPTSKAAKLHLLHFDGNTDAGSNFRLVGGVALTWQ